MAETLPEEYTLLADLPRFQPYVFPPYIATTNERPDIVVWNRTINEVWVVELTICFETSFVEAHIRKTNRYADLMEQIAASQWDGSLVTVEVGSRGFLSLNSLMTIKQQLLQCSKKQWEEFLLEITSTTIRGSHKIWVSRNWSDSPP